MIHIYSFQLHLNIIKKRKDRSKGITNHTAEMSTDPEQPSPYGPGEMNETRMQHQNELSEILRDFKDDPTLNGILMTTKAGVLLSLTADREVSALFYTHCSL